MWLNVILYMHTRICVCVYIIGSTNNQTLRLKPLCNLILTFPRQHKNVKNGVHITVLINIFKIIFKIQFFVIRDAFYRLGTHDDIQK